MRQKRRAMAAVVAGLAIGVVAGAAWADAPGEGASPAAPSRAGSGAENPLAGPKVTLPVRKGTLVERDFDGRIKRLETSPVQAAVDLLELDAPTREDVARIFVERAAVLDGLVGENLREIVQLAGARQAGDERAARAHLKTLLVKARPYLARGRALDEVADLLPDEQAERLRGMVDEYFKALVNERVGKGPGGAAGVGGGGMAEGGNGGVRPRSEMAKAVGAEIAAAFGMEVKASYERVFGQRVQDFEALLVDLNPTPEQESKIRQLVTDLVQKTYGKPTPAQSAKVFVEVYGLLSAEQREILREKMAERRGGRTAPAPSEGAGKMEPMGEGRKGR